MDIHTRSRMAQDRLLWRHVVKSALDTNGRWAHDDDDDDDDDIADNNWHISNTLDITEVANFSQQLATMDYKHTAGQNIQ